MIPRDAAPRLLRLLEGFPIVTVTGPRQSGKTTLVRSLLDDRPYVSLESPAEREFARAAPADFLRRYAGGAVIDEAQHAPELFSELQTRGRRVAGQMGRFVLTGSQNMALLSARDAEPGRAHGAGRAAAAVHRRAARGGPAGCRLRGPPAQGLLPGHHARDLEPHEWLQAYLVTYAERDARQLAAIQDLGAFQRFLKLVAGRTGQLLNLQALGSDTGVSDKTAKHWLSILETCYLIHYVRPHSAHFGKRLIKMPKLYMTDVGLAAALIGIRT